MNFQKNRLTKKQKNQLKVVQFIRNHSQNVARDLNTKGLLMKAQHATLIA